MADPEINTVGDDYPVQQARVRRIKRAAESIGPAGNFLAIQCEMALRAADAAAMSGDPVRMLRAYADLKSFKE